MTRPPGFSTRKISATALRGVRRVMEHAVRVHEVEAVVVERQRLGVVVNEAAGQPAQPEVLLRELQVSLRQIDVGDDRAVPGELREVGPHAAADLEHLLAGVARELHDLRHPRRVDAVPVALDLEKPLERVRLRAAGGLGADRIVVPLVLDLVLVGVAGLDLPRLACRAAAGRRTSTAARRGAATNSDRPPPGARCGRARR